MNGRDQKLTLDRFESLLDAYGGDLSRWPERLAPEAQALIGTSSEARRLHSEAQALDRLLAKASVPDPERLEKLAHRIVAAAQCEGHAGARVIQMPVGGRKAVVPRATPVPSTSRAASGRWLDGANWQAAAALAASLAFGFAIGFSDLAPTAAYNVASLIEPAASDTEIVLSGLQIDTLNVLDEDQI